MKYIKKNNFCSLSLQYMWCSERQLQPCGGSTAEIRNDIIIKTPYGNKNAFSVILVCETIENTVTKISAD